MALPRTTMDERAESDAVRAARWIGRLLGTATGAVVPTDSVESVRLNLQRSTHRMLAGTAEPARRVIDPDNGLFAADAVTRTVHADGAMLIGGLRALLFQTLHPLAIAGVADHSDYRTDPLGRLHRTGNFIGLTTFGSADEARKLVRRIRAIHGTVTGTAPDGRHYEANDPHLLRWVHITEVDSFLTAYREYGSASLTTKQADRYVAEMASVAELLGATEVPTTVAELDEYLQGYRHELRVNAQMSQTVGFLVNPPIPFPAKATYPLILGAAYTSLPGYARRLIKLPVPPLVEPVVVRPAAKALVRTLGWAMQP